jgi:hypothetical protein
MIDKRLKTRLKKGRPDTTITLRIPTDLIESQGADYDSLPIVSLADRLGSSIQI